MPEDDVQNPGEGGEGESLEPTEPETTPEGQPEGEDREPSDDPLDDIKDPKARAEAKRDRAIARRKAGKDETPNPPAPSQPSYVTKDDLSVFVTSQAKQLASDEVREHWDELMSIDLGGYDARDPQSIAQNMSDRLVIYKSRQVSKVDTRSLTTSTARGSAGKTPHKTDSKPIVPRIKNVDEQAKELYGE